MTETKEQWLEDIKNEVPFIGLKPYSHNIISLSLMAISKKWGKKEANKAIKKFGLDKLGWSIVK
jgi:hypothetical protein